MSKQVEGILALRGIVMEVLDGLEVGRRTCLLDNYRSWHQMCRFPRAAVTSPSKAKVSRSIVEIDDHHSLLAWAEDRPDTLSGTGRSFEELHDAGSSLKKLTIPRFLDLENVFRIRLELSREPVQVRFRIAVSYLLLKRHYLEVGTIINVQMLGS